MGISPHHQLASDNMALLQAARPSLLWYRTSLHSRLRARHCYSTEFFVRLLVDCRLRAFTRLTGCVPDIGCAPLLARE